MATNVTDTATDERPLVTSKDAQEEAATDAEDFLTQAEESCAMEPIG
jgi:hypothetical protein